MSVTAINHASQMISRLASQYATKTKFRSFLAAIAAVPTNLEEVFADVGLALDPTTAEGEQLDICGRLVGVTRTLPNGGTLTDAQFRILVLAKITRNVCKGTVPEMQTLLRFLFGNPDVHVQDLGGMAMHAQVGRLLTDDEESVLALTSGDSQVAGAILPKPAGVKLTLSERAATGFFCFSDVSNPGTVLITGGMGFSDASTPIGSWAGVITT
jgi:hypothetical protein